MTPVRSCRAVATSTFLSSGKKTTRTLSILKEAKAEYAKLQ